MKLVCSDKLDTLREAAAGQPTGPLRSSLR
jgi:hypothetical protein